jgi:hypothetical protein
MCISCGWYAAGRPRDNCTSNKHKAYYENEKTIARKRSAIARKKLKIRVLSHYSNGNIRCKRCGITDIDVLTIDHINSNGAVERRQLKSLGARKGGWNFYVWLEKHNYPSGYQVLCMNCQWKKRYVNNELRWRTRKAKPFVGTEPVNINNAFKR